MYHVALEFRKETLAEIEDLLRNNDAIVIKVCSNRGSEVAQAKAFLKENNITRVDEPHLAQGGGCTRFLYSFWPV